MGVSRNYPGVIAPLTAANGYLLIGVSRIFKIMDDDGNGSLNLAEFAKGIAESKLEFTDVDVRALF